MDNAEHQISINTILTTSSQEYIAATMLHEMFHAYIRTVVNYKRFHSTYTNDILDIRDLLINAGYSGDDLSHEIMAVFIDEMIYSLQEMFPGLSGERATDLAWGGLYETSVWNSLSDAKKNNFINIGDQEKQHLPSAKGTFCQ